MARPPAKIRPSGAVWQAMQSPARARYSPRVTTSVRLSCAWATVPVEARSRRGRIRHADLIDPSSVRLAAAGEGRDVGALRYRRRVLRSGARRKESRNRRDVRFGQMARNDLHAVRSLRRASPVAPRPKLRADVVRTQAKQSRDGRLHASERRSMAARARGDLARRVSPGHQGLAVPQHVLADITGYGRRQRRMLAGEVVRHLLEVRIAQIFKQVVHRRVLPPAVLEREKLVVKIAGGLACEPRKIDVAGAFALVAMTGGAGLHACRHRVRRLAGCLSANGENLNGEAYPQPGDGNS